MSVFVSFFLEICLSNNNKKKFGENDIGNLSSEYLNDFPSVTLPGSRELQAGNQRHLAFNPALYEISIKTSLSCAG